MTDDEQAIREQRQHEHHAANLQRPGQEDESAPQKLQYVAEPEELDPPVDSLEWINSKSASTANLEHADVRSKEWIIEIHQTIARMQRPPSYGLSGHLRAWAYDDMDEYAKPLPPGEHLEIEGFAEVGKEANTRSKDGWAVETATRDTKESIVRGEESSGSGGLLGLIKG